jgi:hypothetical protein
LFDDCDRIEKRIVSRQTQTVRLMKSQELLPVSRLLHIKSTYDPFNFNNYDEPSRMLGTRHSISSRRESNKTTLTSRALANLHKNRLTFL